MYVVPHCISTANRKKQLHRKERSWDRWRLAGSLGGRHRPQAKRSTNSHPNHACSYTFDANGNRLSKTLNSVTESYTYDDADKMLVAGSKSYAYDAAGRTTAVTVGNDTTTLSYDYESRLTQIVYPNFSTNTFTYNGLDTRVGKTDSGGTKSFRRMGATVTAPLLSDGVSAFTPGISTRTSGATKFSLADRLGTVGSETNASQTVSATKQYDAFGNLTSSSGSSASPFGFAGGFGYQEDPDSGLKLLGCRYYDPSTGRFLTRDRAKEGRNWFNYGRNNPTRYIDEDGNQIKMPGLRPRLPSRIPQVSHDTPPNGVDSPYVRDYPNGSREFDPRGVPQRDIDPPHRGGPPHHRLPHEHPWEPDGNGKLNRGKGNIPKALPAPKPTNDDSNDGSSPGGNGGDSPGGDGGGGSDGDLGRNILVGVGAGLGAYGAYCLIKWGLALLLAPATGGGSIGVALVTP